jgi:hypothetical protein
MAFSTSVIFLTSPLSIERPRTYVGSEINLITMPLFFFDLRTALFSCFYVPIVFLTRSFQTWARHWLCRKTRRGALLSAPPQAAALLSHTPPAPRRRHCFPRVSDCHHLFQQAELAPPRDQSSRRKRIDGCHLLRYAILKNHDRPTSGPCITTSTLEARGTGEGAGS